MHCDPYAVVLESYDQIGRFRTVDDAGRPIEPSTTLPPEVGGGPAATGGDLAAAFNASNAFSTTMAQAVLRYALGPAGAGDGGCAGADVIRRWQSGPRTFSALVRAVALSPAFRLRAAAQ